MEKDYKGDAIIYGESYFEDDLRLVHEDDVVEYVKASYELNDVIEEWARMTFGPPRTMLK